MKILKIMLGAAIFATAQSGMASEEFNCQTDHLTLTIERYAEIYRMPVVDPVTGRHHICLLYTSPSPRDRG